jgi:hypothetical protein
MRRIVMAQKPSLLSFAALGAAAVAVAAYPSDAAACGCFAIPTPATPVVQAGERILFAHEGDQVIAYIQIKYQGAADQFGWIVPLPSVPTLEIGTDELFDTLDTTTLPQYLLTRTQQFCGGGSVSYTSSGGGCGGPFSNASSSAPAPDLGVAFDAAAAGSDMGSPIVVTQASIGPYDYAVLKADDATALLQWLSDNRYVVPTGTMDVLTPYIHPNGYFLALKLRGGQSTGDIAPIILHYTSDLPMIPITLTSVGAVPNMGILVWVLGEARAIPRNFFSVVLDDLPVWFNNFNDYNQTLIRAVKEAPSKHGFITQYAGAGLNGTISGRLDYPGRFGDLATLRLQTTPSTYLNYLRTHGYTFDGTLLAILSRYIPEPQALIDRGIPLSLFYANYDYYSSYTNDPDAGAPPSFDVNALTDEIAARIVTPVKTAAALIGRHPYLTRMYTAMSPIDMTLDPVFSSNPDLPDVPLLHRATITTPCRGDAWLRTDLGFETQYISGLPPNLQLPAALRVEVLRDAGPPLLVQDNTDAIKSKLGPVDYGSMTSGSTTVDHDDSGCGCTVGKVAARTNLAVLLALCGAALGVRAVRRRRRS